MRQTARGEQKTLLFIAGAAISLARNRINFLKACAASGYAVHVAAPEADGPWRATLERSGFIYHPVALSRTGLNPLADMRAFFALYRLIGAVRPDKLFFNHPKVVIYGTLAARLRGMGEVYILIAGLGSVFRAAKGQLRARIGRAVILAGYWASLRFAKVVFFQNTDDLKELAGRGLVRRERCVLVPGSGVDLNAFPPAPLPKGLHFLFVSRLIRDKGVMEYVEAARLVRAKMPDATFGLVGFFDNHPTALRPEDLAPYIDAGDVLYYGPHSDVYPFLVAASVFVLPSYHEGMPMATLEALAVGRPVVTTDAPGCRDTVEDGVNGFLVPVGDAQALARAMRRLAESPALLAPMARASLHLARSRFDARLIIDTMARHMGLTITTDEEATE